MKSTPASQSTDGCPDIIIPGASLTPFGRKVMEGVAERLRERQAASPTAPHEIDKNTPGPPIESHPGLASEPPRAVAGQVELPAASSKPPAPASTTTERHEAESPAPQTDLAPPADPQPFVPAPSPPAASDPDLTAPAFDPDEPYWVPVGVALHEWSPALRAKVAQLINPIYRELVLEAESEFEKANAISLMHLLYLEIISQIELAQCQRKFDDPAFEILASMRGQSFGSLLDRQLRLVKAKLNVSNLLLRLKKFSAELKKEEHPPSHSPFPKRSSLLKRPRKYGKNDF